MDSAIPIAIRATVGRRSEALRWLGRVGDAALIERGRPRWLLMLCPCGCSEIVSINLDQAAGPAWTLYRDRKPGVSLFPSVWRESGCCSHFIIWRGKIYLFGRNDDAWDGSTSVGQDNTLAKAVLQRLPDFDLAPYSDIAAELDEVPWDVLSACRRLVREGIAREGKGKRRGQFGRTRVE